MPTTTFDPKIVQGLNDARAAVAAKGGNTTAGNLASYDAFAASQAGVPGATLPPTVTPGTLAAKISNPKDTTVPAPAVVTSDAAERDLANKKQQVDTLNQDVVAQQSALAPPPAPPETTQTPSQSDQKPTPSLDDQINEALGNLDSGIDSTNEAAAEQTGPLYQEQQQIEAERDQQAAASLKRLNQIASGTYPLSPAEQSLLNATRSTYLSTIEAQKTADSGFQGQLRESMASLGINMSAPTQAAGEMYAAISSGNQKVADLDAQMAKSLSDLQIGFQDSDYTKVSDAWDKTAAYFKERITTLQDMQDAITQAAKDQRTEMTDRVHFAINTMITSDKFTYQQKQDAIDNAFKERQIDEQQRHDLQTEAISWTNANKGGAGDFSSTQLNNGAANSGLSIDAFKQLDPDTQNFFVNNFGTYTDMLKNVAGGDMSYDDVRSHIDSSTSLPPDVKPLLNNLTDNAETSAGGDSDSDSGAGLWGSLKPYLGL